MHKKWRASQPFWSIASGRNCLKPPILVGFFLGGLVIHGALQGWWIASILKKYFNNEVSPPGILGGALIPNIIMIVLFLVLR